METTLVVYVIQSEMDGRLYVGQTNNIYTRLKEHNYGKSKYTSAFIPWKLIYIEQSSSRFDARRREKYFKSTGGKNFLRKEGII